MLKCKACGNTENFVAVIAGVGEIRADGTPVYPIKLEEIAVSSISCGKCMEDVEPEGVRTWRPDDAERYPVPLEEA
jgi:hypothetical protein